MRVELPLIFKSMLKSNLTTRLNTARLVAVALTLTLVSGLVTVGCSNSHASNGREQIRAVRALSTDEKSRLSQFMTSIGEVNELGTKMGTVKPAHSFVSPVTVSGTNGLSASAQSAFAVAMIRSQLRQILGAPGSAAGTAPVEMNRLQQLAQSSDCAVNVKLPDDSTGTLKAGESTLPEINVQINGPSCPMVYSISVSGKQVGQGFTATIGLNFQALTAEAKRASDIDQMSYTGTFNIGVVMAQTGPTSTQNIDVNVAIDSHGHSQREGDFQSQDEQSGKIQVVINAQQMNSADQQGPITLPEFSIKGKMGERHAYKFGAFIAELSSTSTFDGLGTPKVVNLLNGVAISDEEYKAYRDSLKSYEDQQKADSSGGSSTNPSADPSSGQYPSGPSGGGTHPGGPSFPSPFPGPGGQPTQSLLSCHVEISPASSPHSRLIVPAMKACGITTQQTSAFDARNVTVDFTVQPQFTHVNLKLCSATGCSSTSRDFLATESAVFDDVIGDYNFATTCEVVASCQGL